MKKLLKNKRGDDHEGFLSTNKFFFYVIWVLFVGALITAFVILVVRNMDSKTEVHDSIDADFKLARATNICFAYEDPQTNMIKQNVIDLRKVTNENLDACFKSNYPQAFTITVKPVIEGDFPKTTALIGNPFVSKIAYARYVIVAKDDGTMKPGMIYFTP
ncbi:hypothetical protein JXA48_01500 [Candidatus Woesearchaeota archaeon]|nr:hypothetical protein [Candidatus Woesearchaeota archaeon]